MVSPQIVTQHVPVTDLDLILSVAQMTLYTTLHVTLAALFHQKILWVIIRTARV